MKLIKWYIIVSFVLLVIAGCSTNDVIFEKEFRLEIIDTLLIKNEGVVCAYLWRCDSLTFNEYNILHFIFISTKDNEKDTVWFKVLSDKHKDDNIDTNNYENVIKSEKYCIRLKRSDIYLYATFPKQGQMTTAIVYEDNGVEVLFYDGKKICPGVYFSEDIKGTYILKGKRQ